MTDVGHIAILEDVREAHKNFNYSTARQKWKNFSKKSGKFAPAGKVCLMLDA